MTGWTPLIPELARLSPGKSAFSCSAALLAATVEVWGVPGSTCLLVCTWRPRTLTVCLFPSLALTLDWETSSLPSSATASLASLLFVGFATNWDARACQSPARKPCQVPVSRTTFLKLDCLTARSWRGTRFVIACLSWVSKKVLPFCLVTLRLRTLLEALPLFLFSLLDLLKNCGAPLSLEQSCSPSKAPSPRVELSFELGGRCSRLDQPRAASGLGY